MCLTYFIFGALSFLAFVPTGLVRMKLYLAWGFFLCFVLFLPCHWTVRVQVFLQVSSSPQSNSPPALFEDKGVELLCKTQTVGLFSLPLPPGSWTLTPIPCFGTQTTAADRGESQGTLWVCLEGPAAEWACGCEDLPHPGLCFHTSICEHFHMSNKTCLRCSVL